MGWWYWLLPSTGGGSYGSGVSHIHNLGAVCIGEGAKAQFFGAVCPVIGARAEWIGAVCPEIAGISSAQGAEPLRYLPFGATPTGEGGNTHNLGALFPQLGAHSEHIGAVCIVDGGKAQFLGAVCPEIAGISSAQGAEPLRYLPFGAVGT